MTQEQITELRKVYQELLAEICGAYGVLHFSIAVHDITKEVALFFCADGEVEAMRVLKHFEESDRKSIMKFITAGGCSVDSEVLFTEDELNDRTIFTVSELLDSAPIKVGYPEVAP